MRRGCSMRASSTLARSPPSSTFAIWSSGTRCASSAWRARRSAAALCSTPACSAASVGENASTEYSNVTNGCSNHLSRFHGRMCGYSVFPRRVPATHRHESRRAPGPRRHVCQLGRRNRPEHAGRQVTAAHPRRARRFERARIQERVHAGLARARAQGKRLGRKPAIHPKSAAYAIADGKHVVHGQSTSGQKAPSVVRPRFSCSFKLDVAKVPFCVQPHFMYCQGHQRKRGKYEATLLGIVRNRGGRDADRPRTDNDTLQARYIRGSRKGFCRDRAA